MKKNRLSPKDVAKIVQLLRAGVSIVKIHEKTGHSRTTIAGIRNETFNIDRTYIGNKNLSVRLSHAEHEALDRFSAELGITKSKVIRILIRLLCDFVVSYGRGKDQLEVINKGISRIGNNLNQLVNLAHINKFGQTKEDQKLLHEHITAARNDVLRCHSIIGSYLQAASKFTRARLSFFDFLETRDLTKEKDFVGFDDEF